MSFLPPTALVAWKVTNISSYHLAAKPLPVFRSAQGRWTREASRLCVLPLTLLPETRQGFVRNGLGVQSREFQCQKHLYRIAEDNAALVDGHERCGS